MCSATNGAVCAESTGPRLGVSGLGGVLIVICRGVAGPRGGAIGFVPGEFVLVEMGGGVDGVSCDCLLLHSSSGITFYLSFYN